MITYLLVTVLTVVAYGVCLFVCALGLFAACSAAWDAHLRGMARVHGDRSWDARVPEQRKADAA